jgi:hypothetical protein
MRKLFIYKKKLCSLSIIACGFLGLNIHADKKESLESVLKNIEARCPKNYPNVVTTLPEPGELVMKTDEQLLKMATTWNPALRNAVSKELAMRGDAVLLEIIKSLSSKNVQDRKGASVLINKIVSDQIRFASKIYPNERYWRVAQNKMRAKHSKLIPKLISLCGEKDSVIKHAAVKTLSDLQAKTKEVASAILPIFGDADEYLAQDAMNALYKFIGIEGIDQDTLYKYFSIGMKQPMPYGRGCIIKLILTKDKAFQKRCASLLLDHLKWTPNRDTMGGASGQEDAIKILTSIKEPGYIDVVPTVMKKKHRHSEIYFEPAVEAAGKFGSLAVNLLPLLKKSITESESEMKEIESNGLNKHSKIRHALLKSRLAVLKKAVKNVEQ